MAKMREAWLKCEIEEGMLPIEKIIGVLRSDGKPMIGLFPDAMIKDGKLKVFILMEENDNVLITVPTANGYGFFLQSSFWVNKTQIVK